MQAHSQRFIVCSNAVWGVNVQCLPDISFVCMHLSSFPFHRETKCNVFLSHGKTKACQSVIFNPDFFVERLRHEHPQIFTDLVLSNITRLIDLPGDEFAQLTGESEPRVPSSSGGFLRSFNFFKRKGGTNYVDLWCQLIVRYIILLE